MTQQPAEGWRPVPDPTPLTTEQLMRVAAAERDYVDGQIAVLIQRLKGMDRATELLDETVNRVPTEGTKEVVHLRELMERSFEGIAQQFIERDIRGEREARDATKAIDAALAAQKEAAATQDESNQKAIDKSERATAEAIQKLSELFRTTTDALGDKVAILERRQERGESTAAGVMTGHAQVTDANVNLRTLLIGLAGLALGVAVAVLANT